MLEQDLILSNGCHSTALRALAAGNANTPLPAIKRNVTFVADRAKTLYFSNYTTFPARERFDGLAEIQLHTNPVEFQKLFDSDPQFAQEARVIADRFLHWDHVEGIDKLISESDFQYFLPSSLEFGEHDARSYLLLLANVNGQIIPVLFKIFWRHPESLVTVTFADMDTGTAEQLIGKRLNHPGLQYGAGVRRFRLFQDIILAKAYEQAPYWYAFYRQKTGLALEEVRYGFDTYTTKQQGSGPSTVVLDFPFSEEVTVAFPETLGDYHDKDQTPSDLSLFDSRLARHVDMASISPPGMEREITEVASRLDDGLIWEGLNSGALNHATPSAACIKSQASSRDNPTRAAQYLVLFVGYDGELVPVIYNFEDLIIRDLSVIRHLSKDNIRLVLASLEPNSLSYHLWNIYLQQREGRGFADRTSRAVSNILLKAKSTDTAFSSSE